MSQTTTSGQPVPGDVLERLKVIVGPGGFVEGAEDTAAYTRPWRGKWNGRTPLVLRPKSTEEVAAIVKLCAEARTPIVPQGGNTGVTYGGLPSADMSEVVVSTARMRRVRDIDTLNDTMTVEAGVVLKEIQAAAAEHDRLFPLSLGAEGSCQIGGNISTNAGGIQVLRYGNTRNLVLGLEVVLPDGRVWDGLRGLRKDNTGYDMKQMFIGAEGTLGIITAAVLRLFPKPTASETAWIGLASPRAAVSLLGLMRARLGDTVSAFELINRVAIDLLLAGVPGHEDPMRESHPWYVLVDATSQGAPGSLHGSLAEALAEAQEAGIISDALLAASGAQAGKLWKMRESLVEAQVAAGGSVAHDVSVPLSRIADFIDSADAALAAAYPDMRRVAFGHVGDGNMHYNPIRPRQWDEARLREEKPRINRIVHDIIVRLGGSISAEHGIGRSRLAELEHYKGRVELDMMRAIKRALDPQDLMNPGKVLRL
jgi:FAD/FMN-containing dehydrogenase